MCKLTRRYPLGPPSLVAVLTAGPSRLITATLLTGAGVLTVVALLADPAGQLLALPAALVLAALAVRDLTLRPVLLVDEGGVVVVIGLRRRRVPWDRVEEVRVVRDRRTPLLEIDLTDEVVVLSRLRLGRSPDDVLAELLALQHLGTQHHRGD